MDARLHPYTTAPATNPWREAFVSSNFKYVVIASVVVLGQGCVWYSGQFWALFYLQSVNPIALPAIMFLIAIFVMPETRKHSIWEEGAIEASRSRA